MRDQFDDFIDPDHYIISYRVVFPYIKPAHNLFSTRSNIVGLDYHRSKDVSKMGLHGLRNLLLDCLDFFDQSDTVFGHCAEGVSEERYTDGSRTYRLRAKDPKTPGMKAAP